MVAGSDYDIVTVLVEAGLDKRALSKVDRAGERSATALFPLPIVAMLFTPLRLRLPDSVICLCQICRSSCLAVSSRDTPDDDLVYLT
jgi:hypothetical protein